MKPIITLALACTLTACAAEVPAYASYVRGEMARLGETPFACYYGSVDATPLFIMLACSYHAWTGDSGTLRELLPALRKALLWLDRYGDKDADGFIEYAPSAPGGLLNQGWKDSGEGVRHRNGRTVTAPVALCEVQGYAYRARL
ncbi:MAG: hypothetical protein K6T75_09335, partial [Acetobacteraceae bacterium]|nr:hypothetical protein [Acetobacteraceae bacterium]